MNEVNHLQRWEEIGPLGRKGVKKKEKEKRKKEKEKEERGKGKKKEIVVGKWGI